jgi:hypothetical protein
MVHHGGQFRHPAAELVGDLAPLGAGGLGVVLGKGGADEGGDDTPTLPAGMGEHVAHAVDPVALPGRVQYLGNGSFNAPMGIEDDELDAAQPGACELAQEVGPEGLASDGPVARPRTSRRPSQLTPTATITATETIRPFCRTFR